MRRVICALDDIPARRHDDIGKRSCAMLRTIVLRNRGEQIGEILARRLLAYDVQPGRNQSRFDLLEICVKSCNESIVLVERARGWDVELEMMRVDFLDEYLNERCSSLITRCILSILREHRLQRCELAIQSGVFEWRSEIAY